jgi:pimeloyl-ACP methyl ester carboxylesterase
MENTLDKLDLPDYWVKVEGLNIHYKRLGEGPPVVMVHGGGNDWHEWEKNLAFLARSFQIYALDLPGFGQSKAPRAPVPLAWGTSFLRIFMENLGILNPSLIGHSLGGMVSIAFAACYPGSVKKLVLVDSIGLGKFSRRGQLLLSLFRIIDRWQGKKRGPQYTDGAVEEWQLLDDLPKIKSPVLIVWGQNDHYMPVAQSRLAQSLIPDCRLSIFPHCGHAPQREFPAKFNSLVVQFLSAKN